MKNFYQAHISGNFYSVDIGYCNSEKEAKERLRNILDVDRLPRNTEIWAESPRQRQQSLDIILESNRSIGLWT